MMGYNLTGHECEQVWPLRILRNPDPWPGILACPIPISCTHFIIPFRPICQGLSTGTRASRVVSGRSHLFLRRPLAPAVHATMLYPRVWNPRFERLMENPRTQLSIGSRLYAPSMSSLRLIAPTDVRAPCLESDVVHVVSPMLISLHFGWLARSCKTIGMCKTHLGLRKESPTAEQHGQSLPKKRLSPERGRSCAVHSRRMLTLCYLG